MICLWEVTNFIYYYCLMSHFLTEYGRFANHKYRNLCYTRYNHYIKLQGVINCKFLILDLGILSKVPGVYRKLFVKEVFGCNSISSNRAWQSVSGCEEVLQSQLFQCQLAMPVNQLSWISQINRFNSVIHIKKVSHLVRSVNWIIKQCAFRATYISSGII